MRVKDYLTTENFTFVNKFFDETVLPVGSFVKPIEDCYLPEHVKKSVDFRWKQSHEVFVYCSLGIILIPKRILRIV